MSKETFSSRTEELEFESDTEPEEDERELVLPEGFYIFPLAKSQRCSPSLYALLEVLFENELTNSDIQVFLYKMFSVDLETHRLQQLRGRWRATGVLNATPSTVELYRALKPKAEEVFKQMSVFFAQIAADEQTFYSDLRKKADLQIEKRLDSDQMTDVMLQKVSRDLFDREQILKTQPIRVPVLSELSNDELAQQLTGKPGTVDRQPEPAAEASVDGVSAA